MALKGASRELNEKFFMNLSDRASKMLTEDMEAMGPVRIQAANEEAQHTILQSARHLIDKGQIEGWEKG
jgi:flagellar motor switch protein FliG